jgi:hypothetical protein
MRTPRAVVTGPAWSEGETNNTYDYVLGGSNRCEEVKASCVAQHGHGPSSGRGPVLSRRGLQIISQQLGAWPLTTVTSHGSDEPPSYQVVNAKIHSPDA